jgi:dephospho-CoA kinase
MANIIIGLVGQIACGKAAIKEYIEKKYGSQDCRFSTPLRDIINRLALSENRENLQKLSTTLRNAFGEDLLAKVIAVDASKLNAAIVTIDGMRRMADIKYLKELPNFYLIRIDVDAKIRFERLKTRNENAGDKDKTFEQFMIEENYETEKTIPEVMNHAKISINNNGTTEELYPQIDKIVSNLIKR